MSKAAASVTERQWADVAVSQYIDVLRRERALSPNTLAAYRTDLTVLACWFAERSVPIFDATCADLQRFIASRVRSGARPNSTARLLSSCGRFFRYLMREGAIQEDPTVQVVRPKITRSAPCSLTEKEVEALLSAPRASNPIGQRDRTMLEVLYATGMRVSELVDLRQDQIDFDKGAIRISGKGNWKRLIPLSKQATHTLKEYMGSVRDQILRQRQTDYVFPTRRCDHMKRQAFWHIFKRYARRAGIAKELSPHTLRHAFATHLISHGTDPHVVKKLLGHSDCSTSRIYRQAARNRLAESQADQERPTTDSRA